MNKSAARAAKLLLLLAEHGRGMTFSEIQDAMDMPKSSASGLVHTLVESGFVEQDDRLFRIGLNAFRVGQSYAAQLDILSVARPYIKKTAEETGETCFLAKPAGDKIIYLDKQVGSTEISTTCEIGNVNDLYRTGLGKAILATYTPEQLDKYLQKNELLPRTPNTITTPELLRHALALVQKWGFAIDDREDSDDILCVASCIRKADGGVAAAVSVATPRFKMTDERFAAQGELIKNIALEISRKMGFFGENLYQ